LCLYFAWIKRGGEVCDINSFCSKAAGRREAGGGKGGELGKLKGKKRGGPTLLCFLGGGGWIQGGGVGGKRGELL